MSIYLWDTIESSLSVDCPGVLTSLYLLILVLDIIVISLM